MVQLGYICAAFLSHGTHCASLPTWNHEAEEHPCWESCSQLMGLGKQQEVELVLGPLSPCERPGWIQPDTALAVAAV